MSRTRILVVEDEGIIGKDIERALKQMMYEVCARVMTGADAIAKARELKPDLVLMDIVLKAGMDGIDAADVIRQEMDIPVIYLTAYTDQEKIDRASVTEAFAYIVKPFEDRELHSNIQLALYKHSVEQQLKKMLDECRLMNKICLQREFRIKDLRDEIERLKVMVIRLKEAK
jgi:CheY-like chemotaxis protein